MPDTNNWEKEFEMWLEEEDRQNWEIERYVEELLKTQKEELLGEIEKELQDFRVNCKRLEEIKSPIQILDTSKNFFIQKIKPILTQLK